MAGLLYSVTRIRYEIDERYVRVLWLGFTVRKIALTDHRKSGWVRNFMITPKNREAFLAALDARIKQCAVN